MRHLVWSCHDATAAWGYEDTRSPLKQIQYVSIIPLLVTKIPLSPLSEIQYVRIIPLLVTNIPLLVFDTTIQDVRQYYSSIKNIKIDNDREDPVLSLKHIMAAFGTPRSIIPLLLRSGPRIRRYAFPS